MSILLSNNRNPRDLGSVDYCGSQLRIFPRNSQSSRPGIKRVLFLRIMWNWFWGYFIYKVRIESFCSCWTRSQFCGWSWLALLFGFLKSGFQEAGLARLEGIKLPCLFHWSLSNFLVSRLLFVLCVDIYEYQSSSTSLCFIILFLGGWNRW